MFLLRTVIYAPSLAWAACFRPCPPTLHGLDHPGGVLTVIAVVVVLYSLGMPRFKRMQTLIDKVNQAMRGTLHGASRDPGLLHPRPGGGAL